MTQMSPGIFELVPWSVGKVHTGALDLLLRNPRVGPSLLELLGIEGPLKAEPAREYSLGRRKVDLALPEPHRIAVETKVEDPVDWKQLADYEAEGWKTVLFLPGITGWLYEPNLGPGSQFLLGDELISVIQDEQLPPLLSDYRSEVQRRSRQHQHQREAWRGGEVVQSGRQPEDIASAQVAWVREVLDGLASMGKQVGGVEMRALPYDWGFFWGDSLQEFSFTPALGAKVWVDVVADRSRPVRSICIKAEGGSRDRNEAAFEALVANGPPSSHQGWASGQRRFTNSTLRVWQLPGLDVSTAAEAAAEAKDWISSVTLT